MSIRYATDENFDSLIKEGIYILDFYTTHCGPCRALLPTLLEVEGNYPFVNLIKINLDYCPGLAERFLIEATPTIYIGENGIHQEYDGGREYESYEKAVCELYYKHSFVNEKQDNSLSKEALINKNRGKKPKVSLNNDADMVRMIKDGLRARGGYCPCKASMTPDNKCMCQEFREQIEDYGFEGYCHCKLYYKTYED